MPEADAQANKAFTVNCEWGSVASWLETLLPEDARKQHTNSTIATRVGTARCRRPCQRICRHATQRAPGGRHRNTHDVVVICRHAPQ